MSDQFNWHISDEDGNESSLQTTSQGRNPKGALWFWLGTAVLVGGLLTGWFVSQNQLHQAEAELREQVQAVLDFERDAFLAGDGDLFFTGQVDNPAWVSAQLQPVNQAIYEAGMTVTNAEQHHDTVWANVTWTSGGQTWQRILFFVRRNGRLIHVPNAPDYWGERIVRRYIWGTLIFYEVDSTWVNNVARFVNDLVADLCTLDCLEEKRRFTLVIANQYGQTAEPDTIQLPSPRLLALTENGRPAPFFWRQLEQQIEAHITPATIRFAALPVQLNGGFSLLDYEQAAAQFMAINPHIKVEIVNIDSVPDDLAPLTAEFDGIGTPPTEAILAAGLVRDLTDYVNSDPDFDQADFYEQIWQGAKWRDRTWFMPQAAGMRLLFYDKEAYRQANFPEPSLRWTWEEMRQDVTTLITAQPNPERLSWGFLDTSLDSLFSYAYNWNNPCAETTAVYCHQNLQPQNVTAALDWYGQMVGQSGQIPDLTILTAAERGEVIINWQSARRLAVIWVDLPVNYEHHLLLAPIGVVPFPGSDRFDGITPLWVQGGFISQHSERPLAVWEWLKFLSYQPPRFRLVPARPSIAADMNFWAILPRPLGDALRTAFPFARPVTIPEQTYLSWELATMVASDELTPLLAAQQAPKVIWFGRE